MKIGFVLLLTLLMCPLARAADKIDPKDPPSAKSKSVFSLLPKSFQKNPRLDFNIMTEMTPAGKKLERPTEEKPAYYVIQVGAAEAHGLVPDDIKKNSPKPEQIEHMVVQALRANHYLPQVEGGPPPSFVMIVHWGSYSSPALGGDTLIEDQAGKSAQELLPLVLGDVQKRKEVIDRAKLIGGEAFALALNDVLNNEVAMRRAADSSDKARLSAAGAADDGGSTLMSMLQASSPLALFMRRDQRTEDMVEEVFSDSYFVIVSGIDYESVAKKKPVLLWRTKMSLNSIGVSVAETIAPLIDAGGTFLGRQTEKSVLISKRFSRTGHVELGDAVVKGYEEPDPKPAASTQEEKK